jgi:glycerol uptake facilitator-like aquaporin
MVYYSAKISGGHLNPAVTATFSLLGYTPPGELLAYWVAQVAGCIVGALILVGLVPGCTSAFLQRAPPLDMCEQYSGCFRPLKSLTLAQTFGWELMTTLAFIVPVFSVVWYTQNKSGYGTTGPIMVGLSLLASAYAAASFTGASLNPARILGSAVVFDCGCKAGHVATMIAGQLTASVLSVAFIFPWYGIAQGAWYRHIIPASLLEWMGYYRPPISFRSMKVVGGHV